MHDQRNDELGTAQEASTIEQPRSIADQIETGLARLGLTEGQTRLWLESGHPDLEGISPQELIDTGRGGIVIGLVEDMLTGSPA